MRAPRPAAIATMLVFALSVFGFTLFVWRSFGGTVPFEAKGYRFTVPFGAEAVQLSAEAEVRISGVPVGKVAEVDRTTANALATLELDSEFAPIRRDARAIIRTKTLLGETFIEITPGSPSAAPLPDGGRLPASQVAPVQQLDDVLASFDEPTRNALKEFLDGMAEALDGRGQDLNAAIGNAGPALSDLAAFSAVLERRDRDVGRLVRHSGEVFEAIAARGGEARELVRAAEQVLSTTAGRDRRLTETVRELPGFLAALRGTLAAAEGAAADAAPSLRTLRPAAPQVPRALRATARLAPELDRVLAGLQPVIRASREGLPAATRVVRAAGPLLEVLYPAGRELVPVVQYLVRYQRELNSTLANVGAATNAYVQLPDGRRRRYLRVLAPFTNETVSAYRHRLRSNRHNPYLPPGGLDDLMEGGFRASDCRNLDNDQTVPVLGSGAPPCLVADPWEFQGERRIYQHVERDRP